MTWIRRVTTCAVAVLVVVAGTATPVSAAPTARLINPVPDERFHIFDVSEGGYVLGYPTTSGHFSPTLWHDGTLTTITTSGRATAVNDSGTVAGTRYVGEQARATLWSANGTPTDVAPAGAQDSWALALNDRGQAVIGYTLPGEIGTSASRLALRTGDTLTDIPLAAGVTVGQLTYSSSHATVMLTDSGVVAVNGRSLAQGIGVPFVWAAGVRTDLLPVVGPNGLINDINEAGQVLAATGTSPTRTAVWQAGTVRWLTDLASNGYSLGQGINEAGAIAGSSDNWYGQSRATLWPSATSKPIDLGTLPVGGPSSAHDVNDRGEVVGSSNILLSGRRAVFWGTDRRALELPSIPSGRSGDAQWLTNAGLIAGSDTGANSADRGLVWIVTR
ncbi:hypothetical protein [Cryptosporangium aurantiacum]|uniref:Uncharacterized membrane protein n=1 Tax=Cryptosporangium aurantiacum TaxID=134849 RepID=A0A1M7RKG4_9ACTN|nr:hypothetical protein [Cryptosporangium aurantiacum]SHN46558.1 Uncharacterized membrane protein [Cryptosporangium aurantiacum]